MSNKKRDLRLELFTKFYIIFAFMAGVTCVALIGVDGLSAIVAGIVFAIFFIAFIIGKIKLKNRRKKKKTIPRTQPRTTSENLANRHSYYQQVDASRRRLDQKKKYSKKKIIPLQSFTFIDDTEDYLCMVCKLPFRKNQEILICPFCQSYFHKQHLLEWLQIADDCPVCNKLLIE